MVRHLCLLPAAGDCRAVFDNIAERKKMEQERDGYQQKLEKRLADQTQALRESEEHTAMKALATVRKDGRLHRDWIYVRRDGSRLLAAVCITPIRTASGAVTGQFAVLQDITERVRLEEVLRQSLQAALASGDSDAEHEKWIAGTSPRARRGATAAHGDDFVF